MQVVKSVQSLKIVKVFKTLCKNKDILGAYEFLLKNKDSIDSGYLNYKGENLLLIAINNLAPAAISGDNFLNLIQTLIDLGVDINFISKADYPETVLSRAILSSHKGALSTANKLIHLLFKNGADINIVHPSENNSPLMQSGLYIRDLDTYKLILSKTKQEYINSPGPEIYYDGPLGKQTATHWACYGENIDFMNALYDAGGDFLIQDAEDNTAIEASLNLDCHRGGEANLNTQLFNSFLSAHPRILELEWERLESMKKNENSPFLQNFTYQWHAQYHEYICLLKQKLELEGVIKAPGPLPILKNKI